MAEAMQRAHYPLQALLYSVALHRYLRWRLRGYDPDRNLAGVLYLFLRGMTGADTPTVDGQPCGVFAWRPPTALVAGPVRPPRPGPGGGMTGAALESTATGVAAFADPCDPRLALRAPGLLGGSTPPGCSTPPMSTSRCDWGASAPRPTSRVLLAAALAVRAPRLGHVHVDLATVRHTATVDVDVPGRPPGAALARPSPAGSRRCSAARSWPTAKTGPTTGRSG